MIIVGIVLTIIAFVRGWKFWALLPLPIGFGLAFLIGFCIGLADPNITDEEFSKFDPFFIGMDVILILILLIMAVIGRKKIAGHIDTAEDQGGE